MKTKIEPCDYVYWRYELMCLKDAWEYPVDMNEVKGHLDEVRGFIWYAVGEDYWMQQFHKLIP